MRPSPHVVAAASSLAGAFAGAVTALLLGVVHLDSGGAPAVPEPPGSTAAAAPGVSLPPAGAGGDAGDAGPFPPRQVRERRATVEALRLLHRWDAQRERAWAQADAALLSSLYTARSTAGRRDVALLERYAARGWSVQGVTPRVVEADVQLRRADRVRLRVTEDYPALQIRTPRPLVPAAGDPRRGTAQPQTRVVTLVEAAGTWRVERVSPG